MESLRRHFILRAASLVSMYVLEASAYAETGSVSEGDLTARWLDYTTDATSVDPDKHPKYVVGQVCANCERYKGRASDRSGPCSIFLGRLVSANGWCRLYEKAKAERPGMP